MKPPPIDVTGSDVTNLKIDGSRVVAVQQNTDRAIFNHKHCIVDVLIFTLEDGRKVRYERPFYELGPEAGFE